MLAQGGPCSYCQSAASSRACTFGPCFAWCDAPNAADAGAFVHPCRAITRPKNDADEGAPQGPVARKSRKPLPHCNDAEQHSSASVQFGSRLRDVRRAEARMFAMAHGAVQRKTKERE